MTIIAFGSLPDCNFIIVDRVNYYPLPGHDDCMSFGMKTDKISNLLDTTGYFTCTGDKLIFDFLKQFQQVNMIPTFDSEIIRLSFVQELNDFRRINNVTSLAGLNTGIFFCTQQDVTIWRIAFDLETNTYQTHDYRALNTGTERCISYFGRLYRINESEIVTRRNVLQYYSWQLRNMLQDPQNRRFEHNLEVTDFILDEVNYGFVTNPDGEAHSGLYRLS